jgi:hypothetical protein
MEHIGGETMVLIADLRERLEIFEAMRSIASLRGDFTTKEVKGDVYHYFQAMLPGGRTQIYIGPDNDETRSLIEAKRSGENGVQIDVRMLQRLAAQIIAGGVDSINPGMARVIERLASSGVFQVGGVIVGTVAFQVYGPLLGVKWAGDSRLTQDIDVASSDKVAIAVPDLQADVPAAIDSLGMGFFPVPRLSLKEPSTSYAIRGKTLRVDLLTPAWRNITSPVFIKRLNAAATPLRYLDYIIENPVRAVMLAGNPCLVNVPQPARYALHKLILSQERDASATDKKAKDLRQASLLIDLLKAERPGDLILASESLKSRGRNWVNKFDSACKEAGIRDL